MAWHPVAPADGFAENAARTIEIGELRVAVYRLGSDFFAISDICTHEYAVLSDGFCAAGRIECPLHQACFDIRTGTALDEPAEIDLATYPTRILDGIVEVQIEPTRSA